jgi:antitoxin YefM
MTRAMKETRYLLSIPGMKKSIRKGLKTPIKKCFTKVRWVAFLVQRDVIA